MQTDTVVEILCCKRTDRGNRLSDKWSLVPDPNSPFLDPYKPFLLEQNENLAKRVFGRNTAKRIKAIFLSYYTFNFIFLASILELIGMYGITDFLPNEVTLLLLPGMLWRLLQLLALQTRLLNLIFREPEFYILIVTSFGCTIGLFDAFMYDVRCFWAIYFLIYSVHQITQDAQRKYTKENIAIFLYVIVSSLLCVNAFIVVSLVYFGFVPDLQNRVWTIRFSSTELYENDNLTQGGSDAEEELETVLRIGSISVTLALVQSIMIYLLKVPFHLNYNSLAIVKVRIYWKQLTEEERTSFKQNALKIFLQDDDDDEEEDLDEEQSVERTKGRKGLDRMINLNPMKKRWRVTPVESDFINPRKTYMVDQSMSVARVIFGKRFAENIFWLYHNNLQMRILIFSSFIILLPVYFLCLMGLITAEFIVICYLFFPFLVIHFLDMNYVLFRKVLQNTETKVIIAFIVVGTIGMIDVFNYDVRGAGVPLLGFATIILSTFYDAATRVHDPLTYNIGIAGLYLMCCIILFFFHAGLVLDVQDRKLDFATLIGRTSGVEFSSIGATLYCWGFAVVFAFKNLFLSFWADGMAILKVDLRYLKGSELQAYGTQRFFVDDSRISKIVDTARKIPTIIGSRAGTRYPRSPTSEAGTTYLSSAAEDLDF